VLEQKRGDLEEAARRYRRAAHLAIRGRDRYQLANAELNLGSVARARGRLAEARRHFERALEIYRSLDRLEDTGLAEYNLGAVAWMAGNLDEAERRFGAALDLQRRAGNRRLAAEAMEGLAALAWARGQPDRAAARIEQALDVYRELGHREGVARASGNLATILRDQGRWAEAVAAARECLSTSSQLGLERSRSVCRAVLAQTLALEGHAGEAEDILASGSPDSTSPETLAARALILYRRGRLAAAARLMEAALQRAPAPDRAHLHVWADIFRRAARSGRPLPLRPAPAGEGAPSSQPGDVVQGEKQGVQERTKAHQRRVDRGGLAHQEVGKSEVRASVRRREHQPWDVLQDPQPPQEHDSGHAVQATDGGEQPPSARARSVVGRPGDHGTISPGWAFTHGTVPFTLPVAQ
ncbi:MAG TPA: tetratricopeptide repeat protein, partial [Acidobacteria bacterium]|nr:tetratricopeptide repeat protein [Acidobacteriota bacterium]